VELAIDCICNCAFAACECAFPSGRDQQFCIDQIQAALCNGEVLAGWTQGSPVLPDVSFPDGGFAFDDALSGMWVAPPFSTSLVYTMTGPAKFTAILDFPTGFQNKFEVVTSTQSLGSFGPGEPVLFPGLGVTTFTISGIAPQVDTKDPTAFPLRLAYDQATADFTMRPAPEPGAGVGTLSVLGALAGLRPAREKSRAASPHGAATPQSVR